MEKCTGRRDITDIKFKAALNNQLNMSLIGLKNIAEKGENAGYKHYFFFSRNVLKCIYFRVVKSRDYAVKS